MRWVIALAYLAACGRIGFDPFGGGASGDGGTDAPDPTTGPWLEVAIVDSTVCAIKPNGDAWCWGDNLFSNTGTPSSMWTLPVQLPGSWRHLAPASDHTCGLRTDGTLWCWGYNGLGAVGDGTTVDAHTPKQIGTRTDWSNVLTGPSVSCAIDTLGGMQCWGYNNQHTFSSGPAPSILTPQSVDTMVTDASLGPDHTCSVHTDGTLNCIGKNTSGDLGNGSPSASFGTWTRIGTDSDWQRVSTGVNHTCATKTDGSLWCWGGGTRGQTGLGNESEVDVPTRVGTATGWTSVLVGITHTCAANAQDVWCFGSGGHGELGAEVDSVLAPMQVTSHPTPSYAVGRHLTCLVDDGGVLRCGGDRSLAQLATPGSPLVPARADARTDWKSLAGSFNTMCGLDTGGNAWCWGESPYGQVGDGTYMDRQLPVKLANANWTAIAPGPQLSAGVAGGTLYEWGRNTATATRHVVPTMLDSNPGWTVVTVGQQHGCAIRGTSAYCWGSVNQVGYTTGSAVPAPSTAVSGNFTLLAAGLAHTCGEDAGGIFCWGDNSGGQLGNGNTNSSVTPVGAACAGASCSGALAKLVGGDTFGCALYADGHLTCWGTNTYGQLGDGTETSSTMVTTTTMFSDWTDVAAGDIHVCAIHANGTQWCWGHGDAGQLGNGAIPYGMPTPGQVCTATTWASVAAGYHRTCALQTDGSRWCWGDNATGSLGDGLAWLPGFVVVANDL